MEFDSFEQALRVCMEAADGSDEQKQAMIFCMENAPSDLRAMLEKRLKISEKLQHDCGCGNND